MHPGKQQKRGKRHGHTSSLSTVNLGLNYGLTASSIPGVPHSGAAPRVGVSDDLGLSIGVPPRNGPNRSSSSGLPRNKSTSPAKHDRPSSGDSFFVQNSEESTLGMSAGKMSWQASVNSYNSRKSNAMPGKKFHGAVQSVYQLNHPSNYHDNENQRDRQAASQLNAYNTQSSSQFYLPGDKVIFTEVPAAPGIPIVYRIEEERLANPDKLNLDRRGLAICPILEGEENLRLLNFQHNLIKKIENLSNLRKLIFLDLYDNHVEEMNGFSHLRSLRVLMLGKNRIKKIENLQEVTKLDVLDLHGNKITAIESISHLKELRVLNLASNELSSVSNLEGLGSLTELNLRRNKVATVSEIDLLPSLQRLFMSYNDIKRFQDICCVGRSSSLTELSLDGNPFASESNYKQSVLSSVSSLRQLDMKKISDEERRILSVMARKEDEKRREFEKITSLKERRQLAINNAKRQYESEFSQDMKSSSTTSKSTGSRQSQNQTHTGRSKESSGAPDYSVCHLAELDDNCLNFYGPGSLEALDRNWGEKAASSVTHVSFQYINFDQIVSYIAKVKLKFPNVMSLTFKATNISQFGQINALAVLNSLEELFIEGDGNSVTEFSLWKPYVFFRLAHLSLQKLNGVEVTTTDYVHAEKVFGSLGHVTTSQLSQSKLLTMLKKQKRSGMVHDVSQKLDPTSDPAKTERNASGESVSRAGLIYLSSDVLGKEHEELKQRQKFAKSYIHEIQHSVYLMEKKRDQFEKLWPQFFKELVRRTASEMTDIDKYMETSLQNIKSSAGNQNKYPTPLQDPHRIPVFENIVRFRD